MKRTLLLILLSIPFTVFAQEEEEAVPLCELFVPTTSDSRSVAMGRTNILSAAGSNAVFYNPAHLAALSDTYILGGGRMFVGVFDEQIEGEEYFGTYDPHFRPDHLSASMPYAIRNTPIKVGFGLGYQVYYDWGRRATSEDYGLTGQMDGGLSTLTPAVGVGYSDRIFLGVAYNRSISSTINEEIEWDADFEWTPENTYTEVESSGSFFTFSGLARVTDDFSIGLTYRPSFNWEWKLKKGEVGLPVEPGETAKLEVPALIGVAASMEVLNLFEFVGQYENRPFSQFRSGDQKDVFGVNDGYNLRLGAEIQSRVPIRLGVYRDAILACNVDESRPRSLYGATAGIGFRIGVAMLDTGLELAWWNAEGEGDDLYREVLLRLHTTLGVRF